MIEKYLIDLGLGCGTVKNFNTFILNEMRKNAPQKWYFSTPIKIEDDNGMKTAELNLAFPFLAKQTDLTEADVLQRISLVRKCYELNLIKQLRNYFIVPKYSFSIIPFWANEKGERTERKDFASVRVHILNAVVKLKYRDSYFDECKC